MEVVVSKLRSFCGGGKLSSPGKYKDTRKQRNGVKKLRSFMKK